MFTVLQSNKTKLQHAIEPYLTDLYRLAYRFCQNQHDAEDIVQDLVVKIYTQKIDITKLDNPKPWLSKVLYRIYVDRYRHMVRSPVINIDDVVTTLDGENALDTFVGDDLEVSEQLEYRRFMDALSKALATLNEDQRVLIVLFEVEGYSLNEIQEILDLPEGTIKSRLHRARQHLRNLLSEYGTEWNDQSCSTARSS